MPYGLKNSSPTFQRKMDKLVDNVKKKMVLRTMPDEAGVGAFIMCSFSLRPLRTM